MDLVEYKSKRSADMIRTQFYDGTITEEKKNELFNNLAETIKRSQNLSEGEETEMGKMNTAKPKEVKQGQIVGNGIPTGEKFIEIICSKPQKGVKMSPALSGNGMRVYGNINFDGNACVAITAHPGYPFVQVNLSSPENYEKFVVDLSDDECRERGIPNGSKIIKLPCFESISREDRERGVEANKPILAGSGFAVFGNIAGDNAKEPGSCRAIITEHGNRYSGVMVWIHREANTEANAEETGGEE